MFGFKCWRISRQLTEYIDNELDAQASARLAKHLEQCEHCTRLFAELQEQIKAISPLLPVSAPEDFSRRVMQRLEKMEVARPARQFARPLSLARAGWAVAVFVSLFLIAGYIVRMPRKEAMQPPSLRPVEKVQLQPPAPAAIAVMPKSNPANGGSPIATSAAPEVATADSTTDELLQSVAYDEKDAQLDEAAASYQQAAGDENAKQSALLDIGGIYETMGSPIAALEAYDGVLSAAQEQLPKTGRKEG